MKRERLLKFLKDYSYALYLGIFGVYLSGWIGMTILGAIGYGFDRYVIGRKKKLGPFLTGPISSQDIKWWKLKYNMDAMLWINITLIIYVYSLILTFFDQTFSIPVIQWLNFTSPIIDKMILFFPLIDTYSVNMRKYGFSLYDIAVVNHILGIAVLSCFIFLPLMLQYFHQRMQYIKDVFYTNKNDPSESVSTRYTRLFILLISVSFLVYSAVEDHYFLKSKDSIYSSDLEKFLFWEVFEITIFAYIIYLALAVLFSLKNLFETKS